MKFPGSTVVYTHGGGRLGNQVLRCAHWLAWAMDYEDKAAVVNVAFWPYAALFEGSWRHPGCASSGRWPVADYPALARRLLPARALEVLEPRAQHAIHALGLCVPGVQRIGRRWVHDEVIDLDGDGFFERIEPFRVTTCSGWRIAGRDRLRRRRDEMRAYFRPTPGEAGLAREFVGLQRARFGRVVGVMIRQGDYMQWQGGRFGYSTSDYARRMHEFLAVEGGAGTGILIASDTWQEPSHFAGLPHVFSRGSVNAGGAAISSFADLAECDLILSPPSTFSAAAAFVGGRPLWPINTRSQTLQRSQVLADALLDAPGDPIYSQVVQ